MRNYIKHNIKVGDIITQNNNFYHHWYSKKFQVEVLKISGNVIYLKKDIYITDKSMCSRIRTFTFHCDYIKIDVLATRREKLKKINSQ